MGRLLGFVLFGLGASVGMQLVRSVAAGEGPDVREAVKGAVRLWTSLAGAAETAQVEFDAFQVQVKADAEVARRHAGRAGEPRKIRVQVD